MSQILALDATQIVLIVLIALLVIAYPLLMIRRNKKENQRMTEQTNSLKRGDKILTTSGVYGKIVDIKLDGTAKQVTIETGTDKYKSYMTVDAYAIYQVIKDEIPVAKDLQVAETAKKADEKKSDEKKSDEKKEDVKADLKAETLQAKEEKIEVEKTANNKPKTKKQSKNKDA